MPTATDLLRRAARRADGEEGSATVEFVALSAVVLVPLVYLMVFISQVQLASYAAVAVADQAAKVVVSGAEGAASAQAFATARLTFQDYGITADRYEVDVACSVGSCTAMDPGEVVDVHVEVEVPLPLVPASWGLSGPVTVDSDARAATPRF